MCVCSVFVFSSGLRVNACVLGRNCLCECTSSSAVFWVVKQEGEPDRVPWWRSLTMSILLPEIRLTGAVGSVGQACVAPPRCSVLLCSEEDEMLQYLYNGLMAPVGLSAFLKCNQTWSLWKSFKQRYRDNPFVLGIYSNKHRLFCETAPKKTKVLIKQRLNLTNAMFGWNPVQNFPAREHQSNESLFFPFPMPQTSYLV